MVSFLILSRFGRDRDSIHITHAGCKQIEREGIELRQDARDRYMRLQRIRKHICRMSNREFDKILQKKSAYLGVLKCCGAFTSLIRLVSI